MATWLNINLAEAERGLAENGIFTGTLIFMENKTKINSTLIYFGILTLLVGIIVSGYGRNSICLAVGVGGLLYEYFKSKRKRTIKWRFRALPILLMGVADHFLGDLKIHQMIETLSTLYLVLFVITFAYHFSVPTSSRSLNGSDGHKK